MTTEFRSFVILAGMRTGSNLLEATLNHVKRVTCFGEAFNPYMLGWPGKDELQGISRETREADPMALLAKLFDKPGHLPGFRYFHDHDPRVFDAFMDDQSCAKIILTRNPLDSYVSVRLAWETDQWKLNETETPAEAAITYDGAEFRQMLSETEGFHQRIAHRLQTSGQSGFWLAYEDLRDPDVMTGLLHWLGRRDLDRVNPATDQVPQNPREMAQKVRNFSQMQQDLQAIDPFGLGRVPNFESARGPAVPSFQGCGAGQGLIYMPVQAGSDDPVSDWLAALGPLQADFTQTTLRHWKRDHPGHRSFSVLRHPLHRAWEAFLHLLTQAKPVLRQTLRDIHRVDLPADDALADLSESDLERVFGQFLDFLRRNLNGQTSLPTHPNWASQTEVIAGFARFSTPDMLLREGRLSEDLAQLCAAVGIDDPRLERLAGGAYPEFLDQPDLIRAAKQAYQRDFVSFGFPETP
ncbi:hypothetical protein [Paracoccus homiensis]|uniref:hypothetical protein n=1 Tax=Paracoccus homiensis TaxID=364199 RepID=UPI00398D0FC0